MADPRFNEDQVKACRDWVMIYPPYITERKASQASLVQVVVINAFEYVLSHDDTALGIIIGLLHEDVPRILSETVAWIYRNIDDTAAIRERAFYLESEFARRRDKPKL